LFFTTQIMHEKSCRTLPFLVWEAGGVFGTVVTIGSARTAIEDEDEGNTKEPKD
jgi:hypothetical protein